MPYFFLDQVSTFAADIDNLILLIGVIVGLWFLLAEAVLFFFIFRFLNRPGTKAKYIAGTDKKEKRFITIPHNLILVFDVVIVAAAIMVWVNVKQSLPEPDRVIRVVGQQWAWSFQHPGADGKLDTADDIKTVDTLNIEKDKNYHFKLISRDVMHSFSVPVFRLKQDAVPGREITGWFNAQKTGEYDIQCAEMCGIGHGIMDGRIVIRDAAGHAAWIKANTK